MEANLNLDEAEPKQVVFYNHFDSRSEMGVVSSKNERFVFVKFSKQLQKFGWDGTTSQACRPEDLSSQ